MTDETSKTLQMTNNLRETIEEQRKARLADSVFEYVSDDRSLWVQFATDLKSILEEEISWANRETLKRTTLFNRLFGKDV